MAADPLPIQSSIDYTSRDFYALRNELIARVQSRLPNWTGTDPSDFGLTLIEAFAYMGDTMSYYIDRVANESLLATATNRTNVANLAKQFGYFPGGYTSATVDVKFTNTATVPSPLPSYGTSVGVVVPEGTRVTGVTKHNGKEVTVTFETGEQVVVPWATNSTTPGTASVYAIEGSSIIYDTPDDSNYGNQQLISDGTPNQVITLPAYPLVAGLMGVAVKNGTLWERWEQVPNLLNSGSSDKVFVVETDDENQTVKIVFGDGMSGAIPTTNLPVYVAYTLGGGAVGNIIQGVITSISSMPGIDSLTLASLKTTLKVTNDEGSLGGSDPEDIESIRYNAATSLSALNRAVTLSDYETIPFGIEYVGKTKAIASTPNSVVVYIAPYVASDDSSYYPYPGMTGYGNTALPTSDFYNSMQTVQSSLLSQSLIGTTVTVLPPMYTHITCTLTVHVLDNYVAADVKAAVKAQVLDYLSYKNQYFNSTITKEKIQYQAQRVEGVEYAVVTDISKVGGSAGVTNLVGANNEIFVISSDVLSVN
jgi:hypothetical protein